MSSRSKKDDEWEERIIGFEQLDENYGNVLKGTLNRYITGI